MVRTVRWLGVSAAAFVLLGCPKKPGAAEDGGAEAAAAASVATEAAAPSNVAANEADVTKYPDQKADNDEPVTIHMPASARSEANAVGGKLIAPLKAGTEAVRLADHDGFDLVLFTDPSDATRKISGWVVHSAFSSLAPPIVHHIDGGAIPPGPAPAPATGFVCVKQSPPGKCRAGFVVSAAVCRVPCATAADCKGPDPKCNEGKCYASNGCGD